MERVAKKIFVKRLRAFSHSLTHKVAWFFFVESLSDFFVEKFRDFLCGVEGLHDFFRRLHNFLCGDFA